jgi:large subunit ribosomal protein L4
MPAVDVRDAAGNTTRTLELDPALFGVQPNVPVMHQVVTAQLAAARSGTQSTKTRSEVAGGGAKPYRQKGTGRARQGSTRAPHWSGGGIALGPKPRSYRQRTPKKMVRLALASALSDRAAEGKVVVVDDWGFEGPSTKAAVRALDALGLAGRVLVVVAPDDDVTIRCFRNLPDVQLMVAPELNPYDVLCNDWIVFPADLLPGTSASSEADTASSSPSSSLSSSPEPTSAPASTPDPPATAASSTPEPPATAASEAPATSAAVSEPGGSATAPEPADAAAASEPTDAAASEPAPTTDEEGEA